MKPRTESEMLAMVERGLDGEAYDASEMALGVWDLALDPARQLRRVQMLVGLLPWKEYPLVTRSGRTVFPFSMTAGDVVVEDIAWGLARVCRFGGHIITEGLTYSVAEHCVRGVDILQAKGATAQTQLAFLFHDGTETYWGDFIRPLKKHPIFQLLEPFVERSQVVVNRRFGLPDDAHVLDEVVRVDDLLAITELRDITPAPDVRGREGLFTHVQQPHDSIIEPWPVAMAQHAFMQRYHRLAGELNLQT